MPKRKNSFSRALADATSRLEQAERQRQSTREILARLELEIPALQRTISALHQQLNQSTAPSRFYPPIEQPTQYERAGEIVDAVSPTEDDLLPEPEGTPVVPEE